MTSEPFGNNDDLIARIRLHEGEALGEFVGRIRAPLYAFIERQLGQALRRKIESDDVFQETCAEAVRSLPTVDLTDREPFSWLCQLAERRIIDAHRRFFGAQKRDADREVALDAGGGGSGGDSPVGLINMLAMSITTPSQVFSRNAREARLSDAIAALPEEQRQALQMRYVENLPSKEIAEKLGKSDAAIRVMLTRSLKKLQELLGQI